MGFVHPWAIAMGVVALAAPLAVHFLTRPKPAPLPLSTIQFVFQSLQQRRSRHRLRDFLILMLRALAIAMIAAAIARPLWQSSVIDVADGDTAVARVILIDVSQSMSAGRGGNQPMGRAKAVADQYLKAQTGLQAAVVFVDARPDSVFPQLSANLNVLRQRARDAQPAAESAAVAAGMTLAGELLGQAPEDASREVVIISDFQRSDWGAMRIDALPAGTKVQLESVANPQTNNLAVTRVTTDDRLIVGGSWNLQVEIRNDTAMPRPVDCRLTLAGQRDSVSQVVPVGLSTIHFPVQIDAPGPHGGTIELVDARSGSLGDDLPADDGRAVSVDIAPAARVVLLSNQNPQAIPSSSYYLQRATEELLRPSEMPATLAGRSQTGASLVARFEAARVDPQVLATADVIIVDHPGRIPEPVVKQIAGRVGRGAGLFYCASELVDAVNIKALQNAAGSSLQLPVEYAPVRGGRPRRNLAIESVRRREAPFGVFGDTLDGAMQSLRFGGGLSTQSATESLADRVLATLEDQSALLVATHWGAGRIAILNADLQQSNLPVEPTFLPLLGEIIAELLPSNGGTHDSPCGLPMVRLLPQSVSVEDEVKIGPEGDWPESSAGHGKLEVASGGIIWSWPEPKQPGVYQVTKQGQAIAQVAVNLPASESDLTVLDPSNLDVVDRVTALAGSGQRVGFRDARNQDDGEDRFWNFLLCICVVGLVCETLTLRIFRT